MGANGGRRKKVLPRPFLRGPRVFSEQGFGQVDRAQTRGFVLKPALRGWCFLKISGWRWQKGFAWALAGVAVLSLCPPRLCWVLALAALVLQLSLLNSASADVYFSLTLQTWEQGRFIRFHGLIQWVGWLWPYALLVYLVRRLSWPSLS